MCSPDTTGITYWDEQGRYVRKDITTGAIEVIGPPGNPTNPEWNPEVCYLPSEGADRAICDGDTTMWVFPRDGHMISVPHEPGDPRADLPPGTLLAP